MNKNIYLVLVLMILSSCDPICQKLTLQNKLNQTVYFLLITDTLLYNNYSLDIMKPTESLMPVLFRGNCRGGGWEGYINRVSSDSTLHIFIFNTDKLTDSLIKKRDYKRLDFKIKELDSLKWRVEIKDKDMEW